MTTFDARPTSHHGNQRGSTVTLRRERDTPVTLPRRYQYGALVQGSNGESTTFDDTPALVAGRYDTAVYGTAYYGS
jgi:hypothetical protein